MASHLPAQNFNTLANFDGSNGQLPELPPVQGVDGNLYGVTEEGGPNNVGTVYKIVPEGTLSTLYNFCSQPNCIDGQFPFDLLPGTDGNLYGVTLYGGVGGPESGANGGETGITGAGTVFKLTLEGELTTIYSFCPQAKCPDGSLPNGLLLASEGNFYGTTMGGGAHNAGTIFKLTPQGALTVLHNFCSQPYCAGGYDLDETTGTLIEGVDGNFYGVTDLGGSRVGNCSPYGCGTAYQITPQGKFTTLYTFCSEPNCADGMRPYWLTQAANGDFYGVTGNGGAFKVSGGTIFKLATNGQLTTVYSFCAKSDCTDGSGPGWLVQAAGGGNFFGTTFKGGLGTNCRDNGCGTIFEIAATGNLESLHSFDAIDGVNPYGLAQATNGTFYGTTADGGLDDDGTVFSLSTGLSPFAESLPTTGKAGTSVLILGTDLTGTTAVSFNGAAAKFTVVSATEITAAVPTGATTGNITVTTPSGTLVSNVVFRVKP
jgi:uncharacterized repeat protein (TIGR03803 family)